MTYTKIVVAIAAYLVLASNVYAGNRTHVTETQGAGKSRASILFDLASFNMSGSKDFAGGGKTAFTAKGTGNRLTLAYILGVTDRFDIGISMPVSDTSTVDAEYTGANVDKAQLKYEGSGDVTLLAQGLLLDKQNDKVSWLVGIMVRPSTASSDAPTPELTSNGAVVQTGKTGGSGNGFLSTMIGTAISIPTGAGDVYFGIRHAVYGEKTTSGVKSKDGGDTWLDLGIEIMPSEKTTITPYVRYLNTEAGYDGTDKSLASNSLDAGLTVTRDVTNNLSVSFTGEYTKTGDSVTNYSSGDKSTVSGSGFTFGISGMVFF